MPSPSTPVLPKKRLQTNVDAILAGLDQLYPDADCELAWKNPLQLLVATILSAQCTDKRVNMVTPTLFKRYPDAKSLAAADPAELEEIIRSTGFYRNKAKSIRGAAQRIIDVYGGKVPNTMEELTTIPGAARKTANVVLGTAFGLNEGFVVDTHIARLSKRLKLSRKDDPVAIEQDLMKKIPRERWTKTGHQLIWHGRRICDARKPKCEQCLLASHCPSAFRV